MELMSIIDNLTEKLLNYDKDFFNRHNIPDLILNARSESNNFFVYNADNNIIKVVESVSKEYDDICMFYLNKYIVLNLIENSLDLIGGYPESIGRLFLERFKLITDDIKNHPEKPYGFDSDIFRKDISICCLHMFPAGARVVHPCGVGRRFIINGGIKQFVSSLAFYLFRMRKNYPFYQTHVDTRCLAEFTEEGLKKCYLRIAEMLKEHRHIRGITGGSWFYDPIVEKISPRLSYLRKLPLSNGAKIFRNGSNDLDVKNATAKSATRKNLYLKGEYNPTSYVMIWMRDDMIKWANANKHLFSEL